MIAISAPPENKKKLELSRAYTPRALHHSYAVGSRFCFDYMSFYAHVFFGNEHLVYSVQSVVILAYIRLKCNLAAVIIIYQTFYIIFN